MEEELDFDSLVTGDELDSGGSQKHEENVDVNNDDNNQVDDNEDVENEQDDDNEGNDGNEGGEENDDNDDEGSGEVGGNNGGSESKYTSLAKALIADGVIDSVDGLDVKDADTFRELLNKNIEGKLTLQQQRVNAALEAGVEPDEIKDFESGINDLNNITQEAVEDESDNGAELRKQLIFQSALSRGMSEQQANREVQKSIKAGTDIDDAKDGLDFLKNELMGRYKALVQERNEAQQAQNKKNEERFQGIQKFIMEDDKDMLGDLPKKTRQMMMDALYKKDQKDNDGNNITAIQKLATENPSKFNALLSYAYVMSKGGTDMAGLGRSIANKANKKQMNNLEKMLNNQQSNGGNFRYVSGNDDGSGTDDDFKKLLGL